MYVDFWVLAIFVVLFGIMAVWNRNAGFDEGVRSTLTNLLELRVITIDDVKRAERLLAEKE